MWHHRDGKPAACRTVKAPAGEPPGMADPRRQPVAALLLQATLVLLGAAALVGGLALLADTSGGLVGFPVSLLSGTPFDSYLVPGAILALFLGLFPLSVAYGLATERRFAWLGALAVGLVAVGWTLVQVALLGYVSGLQPLVLGVGLVVLTLSLLADVRAHYDAEAELDAVVGRER